MDISFFPLCLCVCFINRVAPGCIDFFIFLEEEKKKIQPTSSKSCETERQNIKHVLLLIHQGNEPWCVRSSNHVPAVQ